MCQKKVQNTSAKPIFARLAIRYCRQERRAEKKQEIENTTNKKLQNVVWNDEKARPETLTTTFTENLISFIERQLNQQNLGKLCEHKIVIMKNFEL